MPDSHLTPELVGELRVAIMRLRRRLANERDPGNRYSLPQMAVLGVLNRYGEMTIGALAAFERVQPPTMTRTVNHLEGDGLLRRRPHPGDGRQVLVEVTEVGRDLVVADRSRRDQWLARRLDALDEADRNLLRQVTPLLLRLAEED